MKKILTVVTSFATLILFGAVNAQSLTAPSGTSLEGLSTGEKTFTDLVDYDDSGTDQGSLYWFTTVTTGTDLYTNEVIATVKEYDPSGYDVPVTNRTAQWADDNNAKYLAIDSSNELLYRTIKPKLATLTDENAQVAIGDGIYLDTLVQFTAADKAFEAGDIAVGDKIAISYVERDADSVDEGEDPYTNFVVRAGYVVGSSIVATNYYLTFPGDPANEVKFDKAGWHRLTVRAISNVTKDEYPNAPVGFVVYVDGTNLVYTAESVGCKAAGDSAYVGSLNSVVSTYLYNNEKQALLPSLLSSGDDNFDTLAAVGFKGNGSVDDISFTADKPGILPVEGMTVTIAWDANVTNCTVVAGETILINETVSGAGSTNLLLAAEITAITVTAGYAEGYEAGAWSASAGTLNNGVWTFENGATLTINSMFPTFDVGGVHYGSFADALIAAVEAGTAQNPAIIKLLADTSETIAFSEGHIVLDLNGKTLYPGATARYVVANQGASLKIIDTATGGIVKSGSSGSVLIKGDAAFTTIDAGKYEGTIVITGLDQAEAVDVLVVNGGKFYDADYEDEGVFYLIDYVAAATHTITGPDENFYFTVSSNVEPPAPTLIPVPTAATTLVYDGSEQTGVATGDGYTLGGTYAATNAGEYEATATPDAGHAWSDGTTHTTNISWSIAKATVTATVSLTVTEATYDSTKTTVTDYTTPSLNFGLGAPALVENTDYTVGWSATEVSGAGTFTYTVSPVAESNYTFTEASVTLTITAGSSYPSYIDGHDDYKSKYDTWAVTYGADTGSAYEAAFLLNIDPAAADQTLKPTAITMEGGKVVITANQTLTSVNGKVYVKVATTLAGLSTAEWAAATLSEGKVQVTPGSSDTAGFYKIKVDF